MDQLLKAIELATIAHNGQYRKTTSIPYIVHPFTVGMILMQNGYEEDVVIAGILHDTVEDTPITLDEIQETFGEQVALLVKGASEENKERSWEERKQATLDHLEHAAREVCLVVCADKLHNIQSIRKDLETIGEQVWTRFKRGREKQAWYYKGIIERLEEKMGDEPLFKQLRQEVIMVFS